MTWEWDGSTPKQQHLSEVAAELTEIYSASTLTTSWLMPWPDRSHDSILFSLLSRSAAKIAHQPSVPRLLPRRLQATDAQLSLGLNPVSHGTPLQALQKASISQTKHFQALFSQHFKESTQEASMPQNKSVAEQAGCKPSRARIQQCTMKCQWGLTV